MFLRETLAEAWRPELEKLQPPNVVISIVELTYLSSSIHIEITINTIHTIHNTKQNLCTMADKLRTLQQLESLQAKYVGTGHADTTRYEWSQNIVRDSLASYVGHPPLLAYMALGMGENKEVVRGQMIEKMIRASGPPPQKEED